MNKKKVLFIDRDGTLIVEPPLTFQVDNLEQLELLPGLVRNLYRIATKMDYELVMVSNQDGLGTDANPMENFMLVQNKLLQLLENEGIRFSEILIDDSYEAEQKPTRKPGTGLLTKYIEGDYDLSASYVIGDRLTDVQLAKNLGSKAIFIAQEQANADDCTIVSNWDQIWELLRSNERRVETSRNTQETQIDIALNPDGNGIAEISTGLGFFDHMLEQLSRHGGLDLKIQVKGDLHIDEHHTIEDTGLALGAAFKEALKDKRGMQRYGFCLPMDDCLAQVAVDFGGRNWLVWDAPFQREKIGDMPTEMFFHFFKSFTDAAACNLNIKAEGSNEHHKIESIFKAFAKAIKMALSRDADSDVLPSTKGVL